jgi:hypothetical protein
MTNTCTWGSIEHGTAKQTTAIAGIQQMVFTLDYDLVAWKPWLAYSQDLVFCEDTLFHFRSIWKGVATRVKLLDLAVRARVMEQRSKFIHIADKDIPFPSSNVHRPQIWVNFYIGSPAWFSWPMRRLTITKVLLDASLHSFCTLSPQFKLPI